MNSEQYEAKLRELGACGESVRWSHGKSAQEAWDTCERGDWMLLLMLLMLLA